MRDVGESQASHCMYRVSYKQPARPRASVFEDVVERVDHCHPVSRRCRVCNLRTHILTSFWPEMDALRRPNICHLAAGSFFTPRAAGYLWLHPPSWFMSTLFYAFTGTKVGDKHLYHFDNGHISSERRSLCKQSASFKAALRQKPFCLCQWNSRQREMILILPRAAAEKLGRGWMKRAVFEQSFALVLLKNRSSHYKYEASCTSFFVVF